jgi:signal transduction histidine kinase
MSYVELAQAFPGDSEMSRRMRLFDWSATGLGPPAAWPQALRVAVGICLTSRFPLHVWWGPDLTLFYNDAYISFLGPTKHPAVLGRSGREAWAEVWETIGPMIESVRTSGRASWSEDTLLFFDRELTREEVYVTFSFSPIFGESGAADGVFCACTETTEKIVGNRRLDTLRKLGVEAAVARTVDEACRLAGAVLEANPHDLPFALLYVADSAGRKADLRASPGLAADGWQPPPAVAFDGGPAGPLPLAEVLATKRPADADLSGVGLRLISPPWPDAPRTAVVLPVRAAARESLAGLLVAGVSPRRPLDTAYRTFLDLVAGHIGTALAEARAYEEERRRAEGRNELELRVRERTEQLQQSEARLTSELATMARLHELGTRLLASADLTSALEEVLDAAISLHRADMGNVQMYDPRRRVLEIVAARGFGRDFLDQFRTANGEAATACGRALRGELPAVVEDVQVDPAYEPFRAAAAAAGYRAVQATPLHGRGGELLGMVSTYFRKPHRPSDHDQRVLDLYGRMAAGFIERVRAEQALREADRHKNEFLAMLGHELRNPLTSLRGVVDMLRRQNPDKAAAEHGYAMLERQVEHLTRLVDDLLDVARVARGKIKLQKEPLELAQIVEQAVEMATPVLRERGQKLAVSLPHRPLRLEGDRTRLTQVLFNLLENAAKYTKSGGKISLRGDHDGGQAVVRVRDNGTGMPPELVPRVFDLFTQGERSPDRPQGGLGLGLPLVQRLVELHGGSVEARSEGTGRGSEFVVRLPCLPAEAPASRPPAPLPPPREAVKVDRVLVIDDDPDVAESLVMLLFGLARRVRTVEDGLRALEEARFFRPNIVLCDIGLPGMDGYEVARQLRREPGLEKTLLVAVSGYGQEEDRRRSAEAGFDRHLVKPVRRATLEELVRGALTDRGNLAEQSQTQQH